MCINLLTILTSQGHISKVFVLPEVTKYGICVVLEINEFDMKSSSHPETGGERGG